METSDDFIHISFADTWSLLSKFALSCTNANLTPHDLFEYNPDFQRFLAENSTFYLEEEFKKGLRVQNGMSKDELLDQFEGYVYNVLVTRQPPTAQLAIDQNVWRDIQTQKYPYAVIFFIFRAGLHSLAIEYASTYPNEGVRNFGKCYAAYFENFKGKVPPS